MSNLFEKVDEAKKIFGDKAIDIIVKHYNIQDFDENNLKSRCPFHNENTASFIWNKNGCYFKCFGCSRVVSIIDVYIETEGSYNLAIKRLFKETGIDFNFSKLDEKKEDFFLSYKFPKEETNIDKSKVYDYWGKRCISKRTIDYAGVKQDKFGNTVFELKNIYNELIAVKYRPSRKIKKGEPKMWWQKDADNCPSLYNIEKIDISKPLVICEGYGDALSIIEAGYTNVVSIPGGANDLNWIEFNYDFLKNIDTIIMWFDNDIPGKNGQESAIQRLGEYRCKIIKPSKEDIESIESWYKEHGASCNKVDANNILIARGKERVLAMINNAEDIPSKKLKYLMDCHVDSVKDIEKVSTGIEALDNILYGNLFGCFTIFSGKSSGGKSSIADIASIISPADNGYKTFVFSGELGDGQLADWIISPLAGYNHIEEVRSNGEYRPYYVVTDKAKKAIKNYYRDKMILYSDEEALETSGESIISSMEEAYRRYGCRVFLVDNLMCISFENINEDSKWDSQKRFIIRLMNFTKKYNTCTNLILHPKKLGKDGDISTESLHGASEIGNLCHRMLWVDRLNPENNVYNTRITVIKDRPTQASGKRCELYYDEMTRRFYSTVEEQRKKYNWELVNKIKYTDEEDRNLIYHKPIRPLPHEDSQYNEPF